MKAYTTKSGLMQFKPSIRELEEALHGDNNTGFCLACGESQEGVEPDMSRGKCEACGALKVYGAEALMILGLYHAS